MPRLRDTAKDPGLIYDVGLHHGQDTDFYLRKGYRVVAFEADPANAEFCRERFADAIADGRLTIVAGAITEDPPSNGQRRKVKFYRNADHSLWGSTSEDWATRNEVMGTRNEVIRVPATDFVECLERYGIPHYLKTDIVGSEMICLRALREFENKPDYISIRSEKLVFRRLEEEFELLAELGYDRFKAVKQDFDRHLATLPSTDNGRYYRFEEGASGPFGEDTPGRWKTRLDVIRTYRRIFVKYWLFGDYSYLIQTRNGKRFIAGLERVLRRSVPGWYDTHARHSGADVSSHAKAASSLMAVPRAVVDTLGERYREFVFARAMKKFIQRPESFAYAGNKVLRDLIFGWGNESFSAMEEYLIACIKTAVVSSGPILECGSGLSTLLVGATVRAKGQQYWVLEHNADWAAKVQEYLDRYKLRNVSVCVSPLRDRGDFAWYDPPLGRMSEHFSMVICDGPPGATKGGRYGLSPVMRDRMQPGCVILLDDAARPHEKEIARRWERELNAPIESCGNDKPYIRMVVNSGAMLPTV